MLKKTIKFENYNGETVQKDFYFHLSKMELMRLAADGSMEARIKRIVESSDKAAIINEFEDLIRLSYGVRSDDGESFSKDAAAQATLFESPAYDELLVELLSDAKASTEFFTNLLPSSMQESLKKQLAKQGPNPFADKEDSRPAYQKEHRHPTNAEMLEMSKDELAEAFRYREENNK